MKSTVERIFVLGATLSAHDEMPHRCVCAIIGQALDDRETRPAVRTIREWVQESAVRTSENIRKAIFAGGDVRKHQGALNAVNFACTDGETVKTRWIQERTL